MTLALAGHGVSRGIAIGRCHLVVRNELEIGEHRIAAGEVDNEIRRYRDAVQAAREQLEELARRMDQGAAAPAQEILLTHIMMLDDSTLQRNTEQHIREELCNAEWALQTQLEAVLSEFRSLDDEYIRTRGEDIGQVVRLVQGKLAAEDSDRHFEDIPDRLADTLVVASDLTPDELHSILDLAARVKKTPGKFKKSFRRQTLTMIFQKPSLLPLPPTVKKHFCGSTEKTEVTHPSVSFLSLFGKYNFLRSMYRLCK